MGFGKKTDFETSRVLDLDKSYRYMIKPAVEDAGLKCIRADEIVHSGVIDVPMYEQLLNADVVIADLSTSNKNAFYELGIRHALRPFTTIIIAEDGIKTFPFDVAHVTVRQYHHLGEDIGFDEVMRFRGVLRDAIKGILAQSEDQRRDSPVYTFLNGLTPPALAAAVQQKLQENVIDALPEGAVRAAGVAAAPPEKAEAAIQAHSMLMEQVNKAQKAGDWATAKALLTIIRQTAQDETKRKVDASDGKLSTPPEDTYLLQRLALATYKCKDREDPKKPLVEARDLLLLLKPETAIDVQTLGLWGSVHKRLWGIEQRQEYIDEAIRGHERAFYMANDHYNGINLAFTLNARAANATDANEAIADRVTASRVRKRVLAIANQWLTNNPVPALEKLPPDAMRGYRKSWYWIMVTLAEAYVGLGDEASAKPILEEAYANVPEAWMKESSEDQLAKLKELLKK